MRSKIGIFLMMWLFTSCLTISKIERNCDKFEKICKSSETIIYKDSVIIKTDTILIALPADTVFIIDTLIMNAGECYLPFKYTSKGLITVWSGVEASVMRVEAWLNDSSIIQPVKDTIYIKTPETTKYITKTTEIVPKWYKPLWVYFGITVLLILLYVIYKLLKIKSL